MPHISNDTIKRTADTIGAVLAQKRTKNDNENSINRAERIPEMKYTNKLAQVDEQQQQICNIRPVDQDALQQLRAYYRIGLTYTSNALEGNTLTESETKVVLEDGLTIGGSR